MGRIYAGTSGWAYGSWKPKFYPRKLGASRFLNYYATRLNSVEVNYTFGKDASEELLRGWVADTPEDFVFAVKAHRRITHTKRLRGEALKATADFLDALEPLRQAQKLGPVLFQLPPNFKCDVARLRDFLAVLPRGLRAAFEFRHESWFVEEVYAALARVRSCAVPGGERKDCDAGRRDRRFSLFAIEERKLFGEIRGATSAEPGAERRCVSVFQARGHASRRSERAGRAGVNKQEMTWAPREARDAVQ